MKSNIHCYDIILKSTIMGNYLNVISYCISLLILPSCRDTFGSLYNWFMHKGDRAFGSILHRRPVRPDSRFLSRSLFTIFEINPIIILLAYTNSNTDIDTGKRKFNSYSRYLKISEQKWKRTWWLFPLYDSNSESFKISWKY